jgi:hypothetical protein
MRLVLVEWEDAAIIDDSTWGAKRPLPPRKPK